MGSTPGFGGMSLAMRKDLMPSVLPDLDKVLVTNDKPPLMNGNLDFRRCADLHNWIFGYSWQTIEQTWSSRCFPWRWHQYQAPTTKADRAHFFFKVNPQLAQFLKRCLYHRQMLFFYGKRGLAHWIDMVSAIPDNRYIILYSGCPHPFGGCVVYDQFTHRVAVITDPPNNYRDFLKPSTIDFWQPLECLLSAWVQMIQVGKLTTQLDSSWKSIDNEGMKVDIWNAWIHESYGMGQVTEATEAFEKLVSSIEAKMIGQGINPGPRQLIYTQGALNQAGIPEQCFARLFFSWIQAPVWLSYIAPGIRVPHKNVVDQVDIQHFIRVNPPSAPARIPPVLLFPCDERVVFKPINEIPDIGSDNKNTKNVDGQQTSTRGSKTSSPVILETAKSPFHPSYHAWLENTPIPAGVYSEGALPGLFQAEEGFRLILPFTIGHGGYAVRSDRSLIPPGAYANLYQAGRRLYGGDPRRAQRLVRLLDHWRYMVEEGWWEVDANGVVGGVERFKEADEEWTWDLYWIRPDW